MTFSPVCATEAVESDDQEAALSVQLGCVRNFFWARARVQVFRLRSAELQGEVLGGGGCCPEIRFTPKSYS